MAIPFCDPDLGVALLGARGWDLELTGKLLRIWAIVEE